MVNESANTIYITVPYGANVTSLVATFTTTGASVQVGGTVQVSGITTNDFTNPVVYTVTAADGSATQYTVTVTVALNSSKTLTSFSILGIPGTINESSKTVTLSVPYGTNVTGLIATFTTIGTSVKVDGTVQVSGVTPNDFTNPVAYVVTAADGTNAIYTVTVTIALSSVKAITAFSITNPPTWGVINESAKTILVTVPDRTIVTALTATFEATGASVMVGGVVQTSGVTVNDFSSPLVYTVTAADGSSTQYTVTVKVLVARELFVANNGSDTVSVFKSSSNGNVNALRQISSNTGLSSPWGIAVDVLNNEIFVPNANNSSITVYGRTDNGNIAPIRIIAGTNTLLGSPQGIAVDTVNNEIFVVNLNMIMVYGRSDSGNVAPKRAISGINTGLGYQQAIAVDPVNNEIYSVSYFNNTITVYNRTDNGNVGPTRTISGANTGLDNPASIAVDSVNNQIFVANNAYPDYSITVYGRTDTGNIAPTRTISGANTYLGNTRAIALDTINNEIFVTDPYSIKVFARTDTGNVVPIRTISGASTGLDEPLGIALDTVNNVKASF